MASAKDKCMAAAIGAFQAATGVDLGVEFEKVWGQDPVTGEWYRQAGSGRTPLQTRRPDMTIHTIGDCTLVVDNKFTDKNGNIDPWRTKIGKNGQTQRQDYNDINAQECGGAGTDLALNKDICECGTRGSDPLEAEAPEPATAPSPSPVLLPPFVNPSLPVNPLPAPAPVPVEPPPFFPGEPIFGVP